MIALFLYILLTHLVHAKLLIWIIERIEGVMSQHRNVLALTRARNRGFHHASHNNIHPAFVYLNKLLFTFYNNPLLDRLTCVPSIASTSCTCYGRNFSYLHYTHVSHFRNSSCFAEIDITRNALRTVLLNCYMYNSILSAGMVGRQF